MKPIKYILFILLALHLLGSSNVYAKSYRYSDYVVNIYINQDGTFRVSEEMTFDFQGHFSYAYRNIAIRKLDYISHIKVYDQGVELSPLQRKIRDRFKEVQVRWNFDLSDTRHTWVVEYVVHGGLGFFDTWDEIYWNAIPSERTVPIDNLQVYVHLPRGFDPLQLRCKAYAENASLYRGWVLDGRTFYFEGRDIAPNSNFTIVAGWPKGIFDYAKVRQSRMLRPNALKGIGLVLLVFGFMLYLWHKRGRDVRIRATILPQFKPPEELNPALAGILIDDSADVRDIVALIIDLAIRGYIKISEEEYGFWKFKAKAYNFTRTEKQEGLKNVESLLLERMFKHGFGNTVSTNELKDKFYKDIPEIKEELYREAGERYYEENPEDVRKKFRWFFFVPIILFWFMFVWLNCLSLIPLWLAVSTAVSIVIIGVFGMIMPRRTLLGARVREDLLGFKMYLQSAERFRLAECTPQTFERYLPYAVAMQVEHKWVSRFRELSDYQPTWYSGYSGGRFSTGSFSKSFSGLISSIASSSASPSSGGGGFSGGAGGGGGGGGGGAG